VKLLVWAGRGRPFFMVLLSAAMAMAMTVTQATLQPATARTATETMDVGDEPGRISSEEVVITEGPFARQMVFFRSSEAPGTVVVHTSERFLYVVAGNNRALRYGLGVGREGFQWSGLVRISRKAEWDLPQGGMAGLDATARDDRPSAVPAPFHGRRPRQPDGCKGTLSRFHDLPDTRHQSA
jgi:lipoprotein-anchoring transpeptidase ErfK/SrfK